MKTFIELEESKKFHNQAVKNAIYVIEETIKKDYELIKFEKDMVKNLSDNLLLVVLTDSSEIAIYKKVEGEGFINYVKIGLFGTTINEKHIDDFPLMRDYVKRLEKIVSKYFKGDE